MIQYTVAFSVLLSILSYSWGLVSVGVGQGTASPVLPPAAAPLQGGRTADTVDQSLLFNPGGTTLDYGIIAYPGTVFTGDRGCSASSLLSNLTIERQVVPLVEQTHYSVRLLQSPSNGPNANPDNVVWFDLETGMIISGLPKLNYTQQVTVFNYSLLTPTLVDLPRYRVKLGSLSQLVNGLAAGNASPSPRYRCASRNPELDPLSEYFADIQAELANASTINNGLKRTEFRVPSGCIVEKDALYSGAAIGSVITLGNGATKQPTEDDCCRACKSQSECNVFVFCPAYEGCRQGDTAFPIFGCQLKTLANLSSDPTTFPAAEARGPPTVFSSGRIG